MPQLTEDQMTNQYMYKTNKAALGQITKDQYAHLLKSGFFWKLYPEATGNYQIDVKDKRFEGVKFSDLTDRQKEHLKTLIERHGHPPEGCTHFDLNDPSQSSWMKVDGDRVQFWGDLVKRGWEDYIDDMEEMNIVSLPSPPYYDPEDCKLDISDDCCLNYSSRKIEESDMSNENVGDVMEISWKCGDGIKKIVQSNGGVETVSDFLRVMLHTYQSMGFVNTLKVDVENRFGATQSYEFYPVGMSVEEAMGDFE